MVAAARAVASVNELRFSRIARLLAVVVDVVVDADVGVAALGSF